MDVKSFFTSVLIEEAMDQVETVLQRNHQFLGTLTTLEKSEIPSLLKLCTNAAFLTFQENYFRQRHGTPM